MHKKTLLTLILLAAFSMQNAHAAVAGFSYLHETKNCSGSKNSQDIPQCLCCVIQETDKSSFLHNPSKEFLTIPFLANNDIDYFPAEEETNSPFKDNQIPLTNDWLNKIVQRK